MFKDENRHYSLRKLSVGLASVLIGISFASATGSNVKADTINSGGNSTQTVVKGCNTAIKIDAKDDANVAASNTESAPEATKKDPNTVTHDIKQKAIKSLEATTKLHGTAEKTIKGNVPETATKNATDGSQATVKSTAESTLKGAKLIAKQQNTAVKGNANTGKDDSSDIAEKDSSAKDNALKATIEADKQGLETPVVQHSNSNETTLNVKDSKAITESMLKEGKTEIKENQVLSDPAQSKLRMATLLTTTGKKLSPNLLAVSKIISPANDTNGGFDEATWGKLNVNDWKGSVQGDYYQLTNYTGDANHVIVPNEADFEKAGISTSGKQVGVTSDLMHTIFRDKTTAKDATVAFSKTDNKQVKAIGTDWHNTWGHKYANDSKGKISKFDGIELDVSNVTNMCYMLDGNQISDLSPLANWNVNNVTNMSNTFSYNQISDLSSLAKWDVSNVTNMSEMFRWNKITDLNPLAKWDISNVTNMGRMFYSNRISTLSSLANWNVNNVTDMSGMFGDNQISDLSSLAKWNVNNVADMNNMFSDNKISDLSSLAKWDVSNVTNMNYMFCDNQISDLSSLAKWNVNNVADMNNMFDNNKISDLNPLSSWKTDNVTNMSSMFYTNRINDLSPLASWKTDNVTNMSWMFAYNQISDLSSLSSWKTDNVTDMRCIFDNNATTQTKNLQAKRVINFVYPDGYTGKKQDFVTQTIDVPQRVKVELTTKDSKPSNNILDWATKTETPEAPDPIYFPDYTVPEIKGLLEPDKTVITREQADIAKPINVTVTYKLVESNTNDAFALDPKNGLHEHANVNNNGGYDEDYWGKLNINDWNYTTNGDRITITGYKGKNPASLIIPNGADFELANGQGTEQSNIEISSSVMHDLAKNATRIGLSKTANKKVVASDAIWQDAFGGMTNEPGTDSSANGGIKYGSPNLTQMDLHNLDTATITNMSALFNGGSNLTTVGDLSEWNTSNVTNMNNMFQTASSLTNIGNLDNWDTSNVTDMTGMFNQTMSLSNIGDLSKWQTSNVTDMHNMFANATSLTNIGDLSKWQTGNVTDMHNMFYNATSLTNIGNLDNWDTNKVTDMSWMFGTDSGKQSHLTNIGDLSKWQTGNVTDMNDMFANATSLTNIGNLDNWDTNKVTDMHWMFDNTTSLTNIGDLSKWQTDNVTDMHNMFTNATSLTNIGNLDNWDTNKVTDMSWMFGTDSGKQSHLTNIGDLSKWQTGNVTNMQSMFQTASSLTNIGNLDNWDTNKVTDMHWMFANTTSLTNIGDLSKWQTGNVTDMHYMFANATSLTNIGNLDNWDTNKVTDMHWMFGVDYSKQSHLTHIGDLSKWDTSHVTDMNSMFANKALLHLNISNWNLTKLANKDAMKYMFANATNLTVIANNLKLPTWYENEINNADYFWNNHIAVITNVPELIRATGDINNLKIDNQDVSRSIFYDSKGSNDAIKVLTDANNQYIADYNKANPTKVLKLADTVDRNDPIALANASFVTEPEEPDYKIVKTRDDIDQNKLSAAKWQFTDADDNNKAIADSTILIVGNSGDTFTKDQITLPKGYEDRNDLLGKNAAALKLPAAGTVMAYTLPLSHHHTDLTKQAPEDEVKQTRNITVHYKYLDGDKANQEAAPDAKLDVYYSRNKFKDDVTGKISYTNWSWDKSQGDPEHPGYHIVSGKWDNLPEQWDNVIANVPTIAGYTAVLDEPNRPDNVNHVNANTFVHPIWNNSFGSGTTDVTKDSLAYLATNTLYEAKNEHTVYYKANDEATVEFYLKDSDTNHSVATFTYKGKIGTTIHPNIELPKGYVYDDNSPISYTFENEDDTDYVHINVHRPSHLVHQNVKRTIDISIAYDANQLIYDKDYHVIGQKNVGKVAPDDQIGQLEIEYTGDKLANDNNDLLKKGDWIIQNVNLANTTSMLPKVIEKILTSYGFFVNGKYDNSRGDGRGISVTIPLPVESDTEMLKEYGFDSPLPRGDGKYYVIGDRIIKNIKGNNVFNNPNIHGLSIETDNDKWTNGPAMDISLLDYGGDGDGLTMDLDGYGSPTTDKTEEVPVKIHLNYFELPQAIAIDSNGNPIKGLNPLHMKGVANHGAGWKRLSIKDMMETTAVLSSVLDGSDGAGLTDISDWLKHGYALADNSTEEKSLESLYNLHNKDDSEPEWGTAPISTDTDNEGDVFIYNNKTYIKTEEEDMHHLASYWGPDITNGRGIPYGPLYVVLIPNKQQNTIKFIDDDNEGTEVGKEQTITGVTDQTVDLNLQIPKNYELAEGTKLPTSFKFAQSNTQTPIEIHLKHKRTAVTDSSQLHATGKRTITIYLPHHDQPMIIVQTIGWQRTGYFDEVTNTLTYTDWEADTDASDVTVDGQHSTQYQSYILKDGAVNYAPIKLPHINGYKAKLIQDKANPAMFFVSFMAVPEQPQNNQSNDAQSPQKSAQPAQKQPEPIQTKPADDKQVAHIFNHILSALRHDSFDDADSFEPVQNDSDQLETHSDLTRNSNATKPRKANVIKHKKYVVEKHAVKRHRKHAKYHLKRRLRKHTKHAKKHLIKHRKSISRKFRKHNLKHFKKN